MPKNKLYSRRLRHVPMAVFDPIASAWTVKSESFEIESNWSRLRYGKDTPRWAALRELSKVGSGRKVARWVQTGPP